VTQPPLGYGPPPGTHHAPPPGWRPLPPAPVAPGGRPLADFGTRLLAYLIDSAIVSGVAMVIAVPAVIVFVLMRMDELVPAEPGAVPPPGAFGDFVGPFLLMEAGIILLLLVGYYVYYVEIMYRTGQTVGKKAMRIRVVPLDPAARLTRGMAAKRYAVECVAGLFVPFLVYVDGFWQLWDKPFQQTLHDKAAQTVVIKVSA
jgi:uncharacterized RDD family membrane protein YckC